MKCELCEFTPQQGTSQEAQEQEMHVHLSTHWSILGLHDAVMEPGLPAVKVARVRFIKDHGEMGREGWTRPPEFTDEDVPLPKLPRTVSASTEVYNDFLEIELAERWKELYV